MYEQNLGASALTIDAPLSMGTHESQSLFWERHIGLSKSFWKFAAPLLKKEFGDFEYKPEEVYEAVNAVKPGLIRVEADELTYPLHVILRYRLETSVIEGDMNVDDIPRAWKEEMKNLLNVEVTSDALGCLQDVHWSALAFGYFPTYLIGAATSAQLEHYCRKAIPDMDERMERGDFQAMKTWLTDKVHRHGKRFSSLDAMLEHELGEKLNPKYFINYLTRKYTDLYKLEE
jgi:carboxypeptidase Taq